jgi:hypothetical protein
VFNSIVGSIMNMSADIYTYEAVQSNSGIIQRNWVYSQTINCKVEPMRAGGALNRSDNKSFESTGNNEYTERFQVKMKSPIQISRRYRVSNIKDSQGNVVFIELDKFDEPAMIFDVTASHAEVDPLGRISYYETTLQRVLVQTNDTSNNSQNQSG